MKLGAYHFADNTFNLDEVLALPDTLIENELFGTSAAPSPTRQMKRGPLELADGGTAFLDEIGEIVPVLQAKLLRFLEEKAFKRVGGSADIRVEVRVIAAKNRNLEEEVRARPIPRRLVLSVERALDRVAAAARASRRPAAARELRKRRRAGDAALGGRDPRYQGLPHHRHGRASRSPADSSCRRTASTWIRSSAGSCLRPSRGSSGIKHAPSRCWA
jgi:hypothetical protein